MKQIITIIKKKINLKFYFFTAFQIAKKIYLLISEITLHKVYINRCPKGFRNLEIALLWIIACTIKVAVYEKMTVAYRPSQMVE